jgi:hypothetical protein
MIRAALILLLAAVLPISLCAQTNTSISTSDTTAPPIGAQAADESSTTPASSTVSADDASVSSAVPQQAKSDQSSSTLRKPKPTSDLPPIEGSMVGYIDNAVVGSEFRLRFDDAFGNDAPDRAEFFYAQCGCDGAGAHGPGPGLAKNIDFQQLYMRAEYAPNKNFSLLVDVPVRFLYPQSFDLNTVPAGQTPFSREVGFSDVQVGFKLALLATPRQYFTVQFVTTIPSGNSFHGLGTGHYSMMPSLLYFQKVTDRFSVEGQVGDTHPLQSSGSAAFAGDVFTYGIGPSYELYHGENLRFAPIVELVGWRVLGGMENNDAALIASGYTQPLVSSDGINIVNLKVGARTSFGNHQSFYMGFGQALTHDVWYKHIVRLEYRYTF